MPTSERRKEAFAEELIDGAAGHADTDNEEILAIRARYEEVLEKPKAVISAEAEGVRAADPA